MTPPETARVHIGRAYWHLGLVVTQAEKNGEADPEHPSIVHVPFTTNQLANLRDFLQEVKG